ncbi:MAG: single-stranded DNA-binding protein [Methylobacter sp.]|uniref:single-stranded DNA-binding protein n=1 Tax=Methylobacter sp. TaxID=2051955 RepID=UPI0025E1BD97|nr:single-stranded DNA-binding protein [Methylobacter sp.]MCK9622187.1 single-stranded DNA-binding protein [Methylobacter sp.]
MILTGLARLGRDAEIRFTGQGEPVASLALAFNYGQKQQDGNRPAQWVDAALWGKRAEALAPYLKKGGLVSVTLSDPHIETYQTQGGERSKIVARVLDIELAGGGQRNEQQPRPAPTAQAQPPANYNDFDDDIPFVSLNWQIRRHLI